MSIAEIRNLNKTYPSFCLKDVSFDINEGEITGFVGRNGAWAQNIGEDEMFIDFIGTKGGVRLQYGKDFTLYSTKNGMLTKTTFEFDMPNMFRTEIDSFIDCIESGEKLPSHIDTNIITAQMMDAIYRSAEEHKEVTL